MRIKGDVSPVRTSPNATAATLRAAFDVPRACTVGLEEELMLLDGESLDLAPRAVEVLARLDGDARFKQEMPAAQLEIAGSPAAGVAGAAQELLEARTQLAAAAAGIARPAGAGAHPFAHGDGALNVGARYDEIAQEYGVIARRQLVFGLHVHVAVGDADRALAVYNALREHVPALAALGACAPFYEGADTGLASVRPKLCDLLPRQGVPPVIASWEALAEAFAWGGTSQRFADPSQWWWEARLHPIHGTVEVRVPDAQPRVRDAAALGALVHALVVTLAERHDAEHLPAPAPSWRIAENRWSACRHGVEGRWADVRTGATMPMRDRLHALVDEVQPAARALGCVAELEDVRTLIERPHPPLLRELAGELGVTGVAAWLAGQFLEP
jgi:carboxylate-amine ligase